MSRDTMQITSVQEERKRGITVGGKLENVTALIDDLMLEWYLDKNRSVVLLPRMGYQEDKIRPWWSVYNRDGPDERRLMGGIHARGRPPAHTKLVFELGGFPDSDLFWKMVDGLIERIEQEGFIELQPSHMKDEEGKKPIFVSYRRADSAGHAGRLYDRLSKRFGEGQIFMDVATIESSLDFRKVAEEAAGSCDVLIAIIGRQWLTIADAATGRRRLDDPEDLVRLEIATALDRNIPVIPVLVGGATMPPETDLPDALKELAHRNALDISDTRFDYDVGRLIETMEKVQGVSEPPPPTPEIEIREHP